MITVEFIVPSFDDAHDLLVYRVTDVTTTTTTTTTASSSSYIPLGTSCSGASFAKTHAVVGLHRKQVDEDQDKNKNNNTHFVTVTTTTTTPIVLVVCQHATVVAASYTLPMTTLLWWLQPNDENDSNEDAVRETICFVLLLRVLEEKQCSLVSCRYPLFSFPPLH
uniref:Uncharacterized protein n=1 Tax=Amphora coffeiformis TaxID=265554 RepID=A0A7S3L6S4_9STRA